MPPCGRWITPFSSRGLLLTGSRPVFDGLCALGGKLAIPSATPIGRVCRARRLGTARGHHPLPARPAARASRRSRGARPGRGPSRGRSSAKTGSCRSPASADRPGSDRGRGRRRRRETRQEGESRRGAACDEHELWAVFGRVDTVLIEQPRRTVRHATFSVCFATAFRSSGVSVYDTDAEARLHAAQKRFSLPCGQGLQSAQSRFSFPCGHGLQSAQLSFRLPCGHRFTPITSPSRLRQGSRAPLASSRPVPRVVNASPLRMETKLRRPFT